MLGERRPRSIKEKQELPIRKIRVAQHFRPCNSEVTLPYCKDDSAYHGFLYRCSAGSVSGGRAPWGSAHGVA